ncbi:MAG: histidinol dehydrogenase, partial [Candidatus Nitrosomaritimum yanchengensis]
KSVNQAVVKLIPKIKRSEFVKKSLKQNGFIAICKNQSDMINLANELAPEHLQIMTKNPQHLATKITTPGLILLGKDTPSSASDYILGSNHILPTNGFGKTRGSLSVLDFIKINTQVSATRKSLSKIANYLDVFTKAEGLPNHYEAVRGRLE